MKHIHFIINPNSGSDAFSVTDLEKHLLTTACKWTIHTTQKPGDGQQLAQRAIESGCDIVVACGGDGTVSEVAQAVVGTEAALGILPIGTANVLAAELGIPNNPLDALAIITSTSPTYKIIDAGDVDGSFFLLRVGYGLEAAMTLTVDKQLKTKIGKWAYLLTALRLRSEVSKVRYSLVIDGKSYKKRGVTCMICNSANVGIQGAQFLNNIDIADGLLHVVILKNAGVKTIFALLQQMVTSFLPSKSKMNIGEGIVYWRGKQITLTCKPPQLAARDGERIDNPQRITARILPAAVRVVVSDK